MSGRRLALALSLLVGCGQGNIGAGHGDASARDLRSADGGAPVETGGGGDGPMDDTGPTDGTKSADAAPTTDGARPIDAAKPPSACEAITPDPGGSATNNRKTIQDCLDGEGKALLTKGVYPISEALTIPASAQLIGDSSYPTLRLEPTAKSNRMIMFAAGSTPSSKARLAMLKLDARYVLDGRANASIVFPAGNTKVDNNFIFNTGTPPAGKGSAAIYLLCGPCSGAEIVNNKIYDSYYGLIFGPNNTSAQNNVARDNEIYKIRCDAITFMSYGVADGNKIHENGWACANGPIPGGGIYTLNNAHGGRIVNNEIYDMCGHGIDLDRSSNFHIEGNLVRDPGYRWNGARSHCGGGAAAFLIDISNSTIKNNTFENNNRPWNTADSNDVTHASGAPRFTDLPGSSPIVAFVLARRPNLAFPVSGNTIEDNKFRAYCASPCIGVGYFASRHTGYGANNSWSAQTTNYYRGNDPQGSNYGSRRCGGNWYAASSTCDSGAAAKPCNTDDYQHPTTVNWARNDDCALY